MATTPGRVAAASTPPGEGRAEQGRGPMFRTPPAQGAERRLQGRLDRAEELAGRVTGLEAAQQALREDTRGVVEEVVARASEKFDRQEVAQVALHSDTQQAVTEGQRRMEETRSAIARVYEGAQSEFAALQHKVQAQAQALEELQRNLMALQQGAATMRPGPLDAQRPQVDLWSTSGRDPMA